MWIAARPIRSQDLTAIMYEAFEFAGGYVVQLERSVFSELLNARIILQNFEYHMMQARLVNGSILENLQARLCRHGPWII
jgi:hypothetical protein